MKSKAPSQRQLRVGEEVRHIIAEVLSRGHTGDDLLDNTSITVTEVQVSPDLQHASVYVLPLGGLHTAEILAALKDNAGYFRKEVARKLTTRVAPRLAFHADTSFDEANRIDELLRTPRVRQDIEK